MIGLTKESHAMKNTTTAQDARAALRDAQAANAPPEVIADMEDWVAEAEAEEAGA